MDAEHDEARRGQIAAARRGEPEWDELREQRVLARVMAERQRRRSSRRGPRWAALGAAAAAALAWIAIGALRSDRDEAPLATPEAPGRLTLTDGSEVWFGPAARVDILAETASEVRIEQRAGEARYAVTHRPGREFVVRAADVEVRVRGTRFTVRRHEDAVEVDVEHGRVEVSRAGTSSLLGAGEALRVRLARRAAAEPAPSAMSDARGASPAAAPAQSAAREPAAGAEAPAGVQSEIEAGEPSGSAYEPPAEPVEIEARGGTGAPAATEGRAVAETEARTARPAHRAASFGQMLAEADVARRAGRLDEAARVLRAAASAYPQDPRVATALFSLGRVERRRGRDAAAAAAFERAYAHDPHAVLAEDALAEAAVSWMAAGRSDRARAAASRYLARYPRGEYVERVRELAR